MDLYDKCEVKNCANTSILKDLFSPGQLLKEWQRAVGTDKEEFFVCEKHFMKKDVIVEKNLIDEAIPRLHLNGSNESMKLENYCCGVCLEDVTENIAISLDCIKMFKEISGFEVKKVKDPAKKLNNALLILASHRFNM